MPGPGDDAGLFEEVPCGLITVASDGRITAINRRMADWLGGDAATLAGTRLRELLTVGGQIAFETHVSPLLRMRGTVEEIAVDLRHADGSKVPVMINATEARDAAGQPVGTRFAVFRAVERRGFERTLRDARQHAEEAILAEQETAVLREQFIAVLGHDLRNPLAAIMAGVRIIGVGAGLGERERQVVREMSASIARAAGLVDNLMDFARGRLGGGLTLQREATALAPTIAQVVDEIRAIHPDHELISQIAIDRPVDCDHGRIAQMASNLIANAITHGAVDKPITIEAVTVDDEFRFSVENQGAPISEVTRAQLFEPFFRGARSRSQQGLGLGLFIVNEIATAHGGTMRVESDEARTQFTFTMLASPPPPS